LCLVAAIPLLSGCGGGGESLSPEGVARAATATESKGGTKISMEQSVGIPGGTLKFKGEGVIDSKSQKGHLTLDVVDAKGLPPSLDKGQLSQEMIIDHFVIYLRSPAYESVLKSGKKWLKMDLGALGKQSGIDFTALAQAGSDPTQALGFLKATSGDVENVGEEDVRGVSMTHYKATVDFRKYADAVPAASRDAVRKSIDKVIELSGTSKAPIEVWIDKDKLVRRFKQTLSFKVSGQQASVEQQFELYDFGTTVDATPPPADEVQDLTDLAGPGLAGQTP
jgi:hypothetical protein